MLATLVLAVAACGDDGGGSSDSAASAAREDVAEGRPDQDRRRLPFWVAEKQGYFKEAGFDSVQGTEMAGGAAIQHAVQSGQLDLGWSNNVSVILAHAQKFDFKFFGGEGSS